MKIALTVWGNRISPVFDSAQTLLIAQIENDRVIQKSFESFDSDKSRLPENLRKMDVSVLICGAISERPATLLASSGIKLIPFVTGTSAQILDLYLSNKPVALSYFMPGYRRNGCRSGLRNAVLNVKKGVKQMPKEKTNAPQGQKKNHGKGQRGCTPGQGTGKGQGRGKNKGSGQGPRAGKGFDNVQEQPNE